MPLLPPAVRAGHVQLRAHLVVRLVPGEVFDLTHNTACSIRHGAPPVKVSAKVMCWRVGCGTAAASEIALQPAGMSIAQSVMSGPYTFAGSGARALLPAISSAAAKGR